MRRFIPNLAELLRNMKNMLKRGVKWTLEEKKSFELVKHALTKTPVLINPNFTKDFFIFSFASEHSGCCPITEKLEGTRAANCVL